MANFFALPGLTAWSQVGGWSATSGGASNGAALPGGTDSVIFDANSGSARGISLGNALQAFGTFATSGSAAMSITSGGSNGALYPTNNCNFSGFTSIPTIHITYCANLTMGGCLITGDVIIGDTSNTSNVIGPITMLGNLTCQAGSLNPTVTFSGDVSCSNCSDAFSQGSLNFGGYNLIVSGTAIQPGGSWTSITLVKFTNNSNSAVTYNPGPSAAIWNATTNGSSLGFAGTNISVPTFKADGGSITIVTAGGQLQSANFDIDGKGTYAVIRGASSGGAAGTLYGNTTTVNMKYASFKDITTANGTFNARDSLNISGNSNINFITYPNNFLSFL